MLLLVRPKQELGDWPADGCTVLWFAGRKMLPGHALSEYTGRNDKTRVVVKMGRMGEQAPMREPVRAVLQWGSCRA